MDGFLQIAIDFPSPEPMNHSLLISSLHIVVLGTFSPGFFFLIFINSVDREYDGGLCEANFGIVEEHCPSNYASENTCKLIEIESFIPKSKRQK